MCNLILNLENTSENLRTALYIIQSYILLNPSVYLYRHGKEVIKCCTYLLSDMRPEGVLMVMKLFEDCLRSKSDYAMELLRPAMVDIFK